MSSLSMVSRNDASANSEADIAVSIVIPCYNAASWIAETIASAVSQQGVGREILIIDDGSSDDSPQIACAATRRLSDVHVVREQHRGVSHARNVGTRLARGAFVQYLDADDLLEPDTLAQRVQALEESYADIAYCGWRLWERRPDGSFGSGAVVSRVLGDRPDVELLTDAWWPPGAILYRREVVERVGPWNEHLTIAQDANFLVKAASQGLKFARVENVGLKYRILESSLSHQDPDLFLLEACWSAFDIERIWTADGRLDSLRKTTLVRLYRHLSRAIAGNVEMSREMARRIVKLESSA